MLRRYLYAKDSMNYEGIVSELGYVLWYVAEVCQGLNLTMDTIALNNIAELRKAHPRKYMTDGDNEP